MTFGKSWWWEEKKEAPAAIFFHILQSSIYQKEGLCKQCCQLSISDELLLRFFQLIWVLCIVRNDYPSKAQSTYCKEFELFIILKLFWLLYKTIEKWHFKSKAQKYLTLYKEFSLAWLLLCLNLQFQTVCLWYFELVTLGFNIYLAFLCKHSWTKTRIHTWNSFFQSLKYSL